MYLKILSSWSQEWVLLLFSHNMLNIPCKGLIVATGFQIVGNTKCLGNFMNRRDNKYNVSLEYYILIAMKFVLRLKEQEDWIHQVSIW